jgi:hypothetical protein
MRRSEVREWAYSNQRGSEGFRKGKNNSKQTWLGGLKGLPDNSIPMISAAEAELILHALRHASRQKASGQVPPCPDAQDELSHTV